MTMTMTSVRNPPPQGKDMPFGFFFLSYPGIEGDYVS